jgi:uncharacterized protein (DUF1786 family)
LGVNKPKKTVATYFVSVFLIILRKLTLIFFIDVVTVACSGFGGLVVSMLASGTQDRGFAPDRSRRIFRLKKSSAYLPSEGK